MPEPAAKIEGTMLQVMRDVDYNRQVYGWVAGNVGTIALSTLDLAKHVGQMDTRIDGLSEHLGKLDDRVGRLEVHAAATNERLDKIDGRLDTVETELGLVRDDVRVVLAQVERIGAYIVRDELKD